MFSDHSTLVDLTGARLTSVQENLEVLFELRKTFQQITNKSIMKNYENGFQNEAEIDTKSHQQLLPEQVAKQIMTVMNTMFF